MSSEQQFILKASCPSDAGIVAAISELLFHRGGYIEQINEFDDRGSGNFFIRVLFSITEGDRLTQQEFASLFAAIAKRFSLSWSLLEKLAKPKILVMVSKYDHCLNDLLYRWRIGQLPAEITAVVSNHPDLESLVHWHGIPYYYLPVTADTKQVQELRLRSLIDETQSELVVLARYMQVLSEELCQTLEGRVINIHHSLLPGFKGAKPYHRAYDRGVKMVGATAHYVTADLDEGPIIAQAVQAVDHTNSPEDLIAAGRDTESATLSRAVIAHCEQRVFLNGTKVVVFP